MRVAMVTGAAQGIGAAICRALARDGMKVVAVDLNLDLAQQVANEISGTAFQLDVSDTASHAKLLAQVGIVHTLVNCAGICRTESIHQITPDNWERTFAVNSAGAFFLSRLFAEAMKASGGGSIVNIASVSGFLPKLEQAAYGASKASLVSFTRSLALTYGPCGIRVNAVAPGVIETPLTQSIAEQRGQLRNVAPMETLAPVIEATPLKRIGTAEEVAEAVAFLASDRASFITGQTLNVCGGYLMR
ncbi:MAG: SDR family oxidoreductase [Armatimonadetes bacterium]|nr:SDR family oxidoreductase [Armatimonadota bacterium]